MEAYLTTARQGNWVAVVLAFPDSEQAFQLEVIAVNRLHHPERDLEMCLNTKPWSTMPPEILNIIVSKVTPLFPPELTS